LYNILIKRKSSINKNTKTKNIKIGDTIMKTLVNEFNTQTVQSMSMYSSAVLTAGNTRGLCGLVWCKANLSKGGEQIVF
jgi:hypothetical protein